MYAYALTVFTFNLQVIDEAIIIQTFRKAWYTGEIVYTVSPVI